jgi:hypothetical protein
LFGVVEAGEFAGPLEACWCVARLWGGTYFPGVVGIEEGREVRGFLGPRLRGAFRAFSDIIRMASFSMDFTSTLLMREAMSFAKISSPSTGEILRVATVEPLSAVASPLMTRSAPRGSFPWIAGTGTFTAGVGAVGVVSISSISDHCFPL